MPFGSASASPWVITYPVFGLVRYFGLVNRRRSYTEQQLRDAVASATSWRDVMEALGKPRSNSAAHIKEHAQSLGLDSSHFEVKFTSQRPVAGDLPFSKLPAPGARSGLSIAARWFLDRGYTVSIPIEPAAYDLIAESDEGLQRVQVKTTSRFDATSGGYVARLTRATYDPAVSPNARGNYRESPYPPGVVDFFFIIVTTGEMYLIPYSVVPGFQKVCLVKKYAAFMIS